ncbi:hypothetical protein GCM10011309_24690 [Litorimonas cladophorae]|uniref:Uncharacterized protein n=1 Tax=Litorimonas cladophorae TaxID=1220491 RepID=A0A918KU71_9PROT|nr:hypothetical protein [Litorimonas cladophorae]GGX73667.1 hypothetical protein GCM10011309_24690 [Litorimonas cladophorae]
MFPIIRNFIIVFILLSIAYAILSFTARIRQQASLKAEYKSQSKIKQITEEEDVFVARGMKRYNRSYKPKLILGVYVIPGLIMGFLIYLAQYT